MRGYDGPMPLPRNTLRRNTSKLVLTGLLGFLAVTAAPNRALAQDDEGPRPVIDARIEGLVDSENKIVNVGTVTGGAGLTWITFVFLAAIAAGVMFKDARRTHLD